MREQNSNEDIRQFLNKKENGITGKEGSFHDPLLEDLWDLSGKAATSPEFDASTAWKKFSEERTVSTDRPIGRYLVAALISVLLIVLLYLMISDRSDRTESFPGIEVAGLDVRHDLPDGSVLLTQNEDNITLINNFSGKNRQIRLSGNAFCRITSDPEHPFVINTNIGTIQVLGTSFLVTQEDDQVKVTVQEGVVQLTHSGHNNLSTKIEAGWNATLYGDKQIIAIRENAGTGSADLLLEDSRIGDAIELLSDISEQKVSYLPELLDLPCRITSRWSSDDISSVTEELKLLFNAEIQVDARQIQILDIDCLN